MLRASECRGIFGVRRAYAPESEKENGHVSCESVGAVPAGLSFRRWKSAGAACDAFIDVAIRVLFVAAVTHRRRRCRPRARASTTNANQMWPPLHLLGFWLLPKHWRPVATHAVGVAILAVITATGFDGLGGQSSSSALPLLLRWARRRRDPASPGLRPVG